jgi:hypothetical protein
MKDILKTLVGSRAHGTHLETSDFDYRGVFVEDVETLVSPFRTAKTSSFIEGDQDNVNYELSHFLKLCSQGNPNALELLVAPVINATPEGLALREMLPKFYSGRVCDSFMGYARNQEKKFREDKEGRKYKFAEAQTRTLYQLRHLLLHKELKIGWESAILDELCAVKRGLRTDTEIMGRILSLETECREIESNAQLNWLPEEPQIDAIENFLFEIYLPQQCQTSPELKDLENGEKNK